MNTIMKKLMYAVLGLSLVVLFAGQAKADECTGALPVGSATGCGVVIDVTSANGSGVASAFSVTNTGNGNPFDGVEDTLIGLDNNSGVALTSITLTSPGTFGFLAGFEGDGVCSFNASDCFTGPSGYVPFGYEGPNMTFTVNNIDSLTINFTGGLASGSTTWFSLEGTPSSLTGSGGIGGQTPEPASLLLLGTGLIGVFLLRRTAA